MSTSKPTKESVLKEYDSLYELVKVHDYTLGNSTEILERQVDLLSNLQSLINENQLTIDSLREIHNKSTQLSSLIATKVRNERKQKEDKTKK